MNSIPKNPNKMHCDNLRFYFALFGSCYGLSTSSWSAPDQAITVGDEAARASGNGTLTGRIKNTVTGAYLRNVRVSVKGTSITVFTDETGTYRIIDLPAGEIVIAVLYTGSDRQERTAHLRPGQVVQLDVEMTNATRYGDTDKVAVLERFDVSATREMEGESMAINERRFAPNIKNVVTTDSLGEVVGDSMGEFLKSLPGLTPEFSGEEVVGVSARGFPPNMTSFSMDGMSTSSALGPAPSRRPNLVALSALNNFSRVEVTKVPLPSSPADSLAGSVNLISKSSFERSGAELRYGISLVGNSQELDLERTAIASDKLDWRLKPGFNVDYTLPLRKNLGIVATGLYTSKNRPFNLAQKIYTDGGIATGASVRAPFLQTFHLVDSPDVQTRSSGGIKLDWGVTADSVLSLGFSHTDLLVEILSVRFIANTGNNGTPLPTNLPTSVGLSYGPDFTIGATGRGSITMRSAFQTLHSLNSVGNGSYRFDNGLWKIEAGANLVKATGRQESFPRGHFGTVDILSRDPARVEYRGAAGDAPHSIKAFGNNGQEVDLHNIDNYRFNLISNQFYIHKSETNNGKVDIRRRLQSLPVPASIQAGAMRTVQQRDLERNNVSYTYAGPASIAAFAARRYTNWNPQFGPLRNLPFVPSHNLYDAWQQNPGLISQTAAQAVTAEQFRIDSSQSLDETVSSLYLQADTRLIKDRLWLLAGVRHESTELKGAGVLVDPNAIFQRNASGNFVRNAAGARVRKPEAGATGSMEELRLLRQRRGFHGRGNYDGYYPSVHGTFQIRENLLLRLAYAKTYGRPDFSNVIPTATVNQTDTDMSNQDDPNLLPGTITLTNQSLLPWTADNYDVSVEHYSKAGGMLSIGAFLKNVEDFFGDDVRIATAADLQDLGLSSEYLGWRVTSKFNVGNARISGVEVDFQQPLVGLGEWGRFFTVFANGTKLKLEGAREADFSGFVEKSANWGFRFNRKRLSATMRWNYVGQRTVALLPALGMDGRSHQRPVTRMDVSAGYRITPRLRLVLSANNVLNAKRIDTAFGSQTPEYARQTQIFDNGVAIMLGLRGTY